MNPQLICFCWSIKDPRLDCFGKTDLQPQAPHKEVSSRTPGRNMAFLGFEVHGEFEAGHDEVEEDLEEIAGDVDDEASSGQELAEDEAVDGDAVVEREFLRNHEELNMKEKLSCESLFFSKFPAT